MTGNYMPTSEPDDALICLQQLRLALLKFTLHAIEPIKLPQFAGSTFRGAFGSMFRRIACAPHCDAAKNCLLATACAYARVFEALPDVPGYQPAAKSEAPRPFIIHPPPSETPLKAGEEFSFHLVLAGAAINYLPYFILTWRELGRIGIGSAHGRFRLVTVESHLSLNVAETADATDAHAPRTIYSAEDELVRNNLAALTAERILATNARLRSLSEPNKLPPARLTIELLMPARLKSGGEFLRGAPPFETLMGALLRRLESLSFFYCGGGLQLDYHMIVARAKEVETVSSDLHWVEWARYSQRQERKIPWGGLMGSVEYAGEFTQFWPFLALGELVGVGNNCAFGLGRFVTLQRR
jgi:CRISPR-associated endoribonuclease Cas6